MFLEQESNGQPDAPICGTARDRACARRRQRQEDCEVVNCEVVNSVFCSFSAESADKMNRKFIRAE
jgi:hypothetical protein